MLNITVQDWRELRSVKLVGERNSLLLFAGTLLLSASLLFSVQPLFAKMVLPYLGGSPSVWAVAMCFFQAALLAGYCYAHALNRFVPSQWAICVHLVLCCAAFLALPFGLPEWAHDVPDGNTYWWLITVLAAGVGLPFFAVSANAPLLQAWFARSGHPHASDPYFLYGASNLGSLAALLAYPFLIEPMLGLDMQTAVWMSGFGLLTALLLGCGLLMITGSAAHRDNEAAETNSDDTQPATFRVVDNWARLSWIGYAFVPSALLVAFTTHITTDIASAPFLWVIPLATFLGTFVIVFRKTSLIPHDTVLRLQPYFVAFAVLPSGSILALQIAIGFATFLITTLVCHRALYDARPSANQLTEFYLLMSLGGVLGGIFSALAAPQLFSSVVEYPLLIIAGLLARPDIVAKLTDKEQHKPLLIVATATLAGVAVFAVLEASELLKSSTVRNAVGVVGLVLISIMILNSRRPAIVAKLAIGLTAVITVWHSIDVAGYRERSFFGVVRVISSDDGEFRLLAHGSTFHGGERLLDSTGQQPAKPIPALYYHPQGPMARGISVARRGLDGTTGPLRTGVIGLGTGSLVCYMKPGETIDFYEIDPVVVNVARDPEQFRYLSHCGPQTPIIVGDARLTLAKAEDAKYDYLVVDAFSSDAIPVHLLTREAIQLYLSKISGEGLIALHISNRHLELESVIAATAQTLEGVHSAAVFESKGLPGYDGLASHVVFLSKNKKLIDAVLAWNDARPADPRQTHPWSDNYGDIISALWRRYTE